jgi:hypothetical protein
MFNRARIHSEPSLSLSQAIATTTGEAFPKDWPEFHTFGLYPIYLTSPSRLVSISRFWYSCCSNLPS